MKLTALIRPAAAKLAALAVTFVAAGAWADGVPVWEDEDEEEIIGGGGGDSPTSSEVSILDYCAQIGENKYGTIQAAIDAAQSGDTITLLGDVSLSSKVSLNKEGIYTIDGAGYTILMALENSFDAEGAIIFGPAGTTIGNLADIPNKTYTLQNVTITSFDSEILRIEGCGLTLDNVTFDQNYISTDHSTRGYHLVRIANANVSINDSTFSGNTVANTTNGRVIYVDETSQFTLSNCVFDSNTVNGSGVVTISNGSNHSVVNNTFKDNTVASVANGAVLYLSKTATVTGNLFKDNSVTESTAKEGVIVIGSGGTGSVINNNAFDGNTLGTSVSHYATIYTGANCDITGNYWGDGAAPEIEDHKDVYDSGSHTIANTTYATEYALRNGTGPGVTVTPYVPSNPVVTFQMTDSVGKIVIQGLDDNVHQNVFDTWFDGVNNRPNIRIAFTQTVEPGGTATKPTNTPYYDYNLTQPNNGNPKNFTNADSHAYTFDGWATADGELYDFTTPVTSDLVLHPRFSATGATIVINNETELRAFAREVELGRKFREPWGEEKQTVKLAGDITLTSNWTPVAGFEGIFDGDNHSISGLVISSTVKDTGFFSGLNSHTVVKDLTFVAPQVSCSASYVGVLAGSASSNSSSTQPQVSNVNVTGAFSVSGQDNVGALIGQVNAGVSITDCSVEGTGGTVTAAGSDGRCVGGLLGNTIGAVSVVDCSVSGVTVTGYRKIGGLIGQVQGNLTCTDVSVSNVTLHTNATADYANTLTMGGLVGIFPDSYSGSTFTGTVSDLTMTGPANIAEGKNYIMGLVSGGTGAAVADAETAMTDANMTFNVTVGGTNTTTINTESSYAGINGNPSVTYVAQIGADKYETLAAAIAAADAAGVDEITILDDSITVSPNPGWYIYGTTLKRDTGRDLWYVAGAKETTYGTYAEALNAANDDATKVFCLWSGSSKTVAEAIAAGSLVVEKHDRFEIEGYTGDTAGFVYVKDARGLASLAGFKDYCDANCRPGPTNGKDENDAFYWTSPARWTVVLDCNIDLDNKAWTTSQTGMEIKIDGDNHTVLNLSVSTSSGNAGLFTGCGLVSNLKVDGANVNAGSGTAGTVVALQRDGGLVNVVVSNAVVSGKYVGGLVGQAYGRTYTGNVLGNVSVTTTTKYVGGIAGQFYVDGNAPYEVDVQNNVLNDIQIAYSDPNEIYGSVLGALISASAPYVVTGNTANNITTNGTLAVRIGNDTSDSYNAIWAPRRPDNGSLNPNVTYENNNLRPCYVAQIGETGYHTLAEAILAAQDGDTIAILDGTWGAAAVGTMTTQEALSVRAKSLTIQPAEGATPKFTADVSLGYDDSSTMNASLTVKGLAFENAQLLIGNYAQTTVEGCSFVGSGDEAALRIIESCASNYNRTDFMVDQVTVKDCTFNGTKTGVPAIRVRDSGNVLITGNTIANSNHNGILLESDTTHSKVNTQVSKTVVIQNNTITEWNVENSSGNISDRGGRGIRAALGTMAEGSSVTISGNVFRKEQTGFDSPDYVKISGVGSGNTVDLSGNDWNDMLLSEVKDNSAIYICDAATTTLTSVITTKVPVARIGTTEYLSLQEAINAAEDGQTVTVLRDITVENANIGHTKALYTVRKSITIDGNGKTITVSDTGSKSVINIVFHFYETANNQPVACTMQDLTIEATGFQIDILAGGIGTYANTLALSNVTARGEGEVIYASDTSSITAVDCEFTQSGEHAANKEAEYYTAVAVGYDGVVSLDGCAVVSTGHNAIASFGSGGTVTLEDTRVEATGENSKALWAYAAATYSTGDANIVVNEGCTVIGSVSATTTATNSRKATITINDGYFSQYIEDATGYIVEGKTCTTKMMANGLFAIVPEATVTFVAGTDAPSGTTVPADITYPSGDAAELALGTPDYTSADYTFGGWKMSDNKVVAALPAGTAGDQTLTATWVKATKIEVVTDNTKPAVEVKVTDDWVDANVTKAGETATPAEIKASLEATKANGLTGLENYVLGLDGSANAKVKVDSEIGASETAVPVVNTLKPTEQTVDTGFKVQYSLDKVSETGTTITEGTKQDTSDLSLDLTKVADTQDGVGYYKMTATITKEGVEGTVSKVSSENTIGVLAVKNAPATTIIGVPWKSLESGNIKVDELVRTENLTEGDEIKVYDATAGKYKAWTLNENKEWEEVATVSQETTEDPGAATGTTVARGAGVWLTRKNPSEPIYLMGQATADAVEKTPVEVPAEAGKEAWTLVASPKVEPVKVADVAAGEGDIIRLPTTGAPKDFKYRGGKWGYTEYYVDANGLTRSQRVETDDKTTIPAGRGFWYINKSTDADKKIDWDKQTNQNN